MKDKILKNIRFILIMLFLAIILNMRYWNNSAIFAHDISYHLNRIYQICQELKNGQFPVIIESNLLNGYGYCNSLFYPDLFLYLPAILIYIGMNYLRSYKLFLFINSFLCLIISYKSAIHMFYDKKKAFLFSILYSFCCYRLTNIYVRGALGEVLAITFLPLIIYGMYDLIYVDHIRGFYYVPIGFFCIANSHVLTLFMVAILVVLIVLFNIKDENKAKDESDMDKFAYKFKLKRLVVTGILSITICANFIIPYLEQASSDKFNVDEKIYTGEFLQEEAVSIKEIINILPNDGNYYKSVGLVLLIFNLLYIVYRKNIKEEYGFMNLDKYIDKLFIIGIIVFIMSTSIFPWNKLCSICPALTTLQFPYRLNIIISLLFSYTATVSISEIVKRFKFGYYIAYVILIAYAIIFMVNININSINISEEDLLSYAPIGNGEYIPYGFDQNCIVLKNVNASNSIEYKKEGNKIIFDYEDTEHDFSIIMPITYYKGYTAYIEDKDGNKTNLNVIEADMNKCVVLTSDEKLTGTVIVEYKLTKAQKISYIITIISILILIIEKIKLEKRIR